MEDFKISREELEIIHMGLKLVIRTGFGIKHELDVAQEIATRIHSYKSDYDTEHGDSIK